MTQASPVEFLSPPGEPQQVFIDGARFVSHAAYEDALRQIKTLVEALRQKQRSEASHKQQFAEIRELWDNLPESVAQAPYAKSAEHLRKHALIATGFCDTEVIDCEEFELAVKIAPMVAKMARAAHGYAIVTVRGSLITCSTPHSQSYAAMGKDKFQESKAKVIDWCHGILGTRYEADKEG